MGGLTTDTKLYDYATKQTPLVLITQEDGIITDQFVLTK